MRSFIFAFLLSIYGVIIIPFSASASILCSYKCSDGSDFGFTVPNDTPCPLTINPDGLECNLIIPKTTEPSTIFSFIIIGGLATSAVLRRKSEYS